MKALAAKIAAVFAAALTVAAMSLTSAATADKAANTGGFLDDWAEGIAATFNPNPRPPKILTLNGADVDVRSGEGAHLMSAVHADRPLKIIGMPLVDGNAKLQANKRPRGNAPRILSLVEVSARKPFALAQNGAPSYWRNLLYAAARLALAGFASEARAQEVHHCNKFKPLIMGVKAGGKWVGSATVYDLDKNEIATSYHVAIHHRNSPLAIVRYIEDASVWIERPMNHEPEITRRCRAEHDICVLNVPHLRQILEQQDAFTNLLREIHGEVTIKIKDTYDMEEPETICACGVQKGDTDHPRPLCRPAHFDDFARLDAHNLKQPASHISPLIEAEEKTFTGQSGGPILARSGEIIGLVTKSRKEGLDVHVPIYWAKSMKEVDCKAPNDVQVPPCDPSKISQNTGGTAISKQSSISPSTPQNNCPDNVEGPPDAPFTFLYGAVASGDIQRVAALIQCGANVDAKDKHNGYTPLHVALGTKNARETTELLLKHGADVHAKDSNGTMPLHHAAGTNARETADLLLKNNAEVDAKDSDGATPLHYAAVTNARETADLLLKNNAEVDAKRDGGNTPLHDAVLRNAREAAELILQYGAKINAENDDGETPLDMLLHWDTQENVSEIAKFLLQNGAEVNTKISGGETLLHIAAKFNARETAELMLKKGADVNAKGNGGETPLHIAVLQNARETAELMLEYRADIDAKDEDGWTPLHYAVFENDLYTAELLLQNRANVNAKTTETFADHMAGSTPLDFAIHEGNADMQSLLRRYNGRTAAQSTQIPPTGTKTETYMREMNTWAGRLNINDRVKLERWNVGNNSHLHIAAHLNDADAALWLIENGADINVKNNWDWTPLHYAAQANAREIAKLLLLNGANVNAKDETIYTPLHQAARNNARETAEFLLLNGANINAKEKFGSTPLHQAVFFNARETAALLLRNDAEVNAKDNIGETPLHAANDRETAELLLQNGAKINAESDNGETPLHRAALENSREIADLLLKNNAEVDAKDSDGATPLHYAVEFNARETAELLLENGAEVNAKTKMADNKEAEWTPLDLAIHNNHLEMRSLLREHGGRCNINC